MSYRGRHRRQLAGASAAAIALPTLVALAPAAQADTAWETLAECESGGDPDAVNPAGPYYGLYQFDLQTWRSVGGEGLPTDATAAEQTMRAKMLYQRRGWQPWPVCGDGLPSPSVEADAEVRASASADAGDDSGTDVATDAAGGVTVDSVYPADNYRVQSGDTLAGIAAAHGTTVAALAEANPRTIEDPDLLYPGEGLYVPERD